MISAASEGGCWESCGNHSVDIRHYYTHLMIPWHDTTQLILAELTLRDLVMVEVRAGMIDRLLLGWWAGLSCEYLVQRHAVVGWSLAGAHIISSIASQWEEAAAAGVFSYHKQCFHTTAVQHPSHKLLSQDDTRLWTCGFTFDMSGWFISVTVCPGIIS